ncbi:SpoIIE family protein phosphatase [Candidatus Gracilibacteria bacterium]|nr:SpoIIE family protein phosphatase [Candidatus Gracilibacteria bacterium]
MKLNIRSKLMIAISALMVVVFSVAAFSFINEKKIEMAEDIYHNSLAFVKLTAPNVAFNYDLYLAENSFVYFNREIAGVFEQNNDLQGIAVVSYAGEFLYDSSVDIDGKYEGAPRLLEGALLEQVRREDVSMKMSGGAVLSESVEPDSGERIEYFVVPATEKYSVIYEISYDNVDQRIAEMVERIIYLALFAVLLGIWLSFVMSGKLTRPISMLVTAAAKVSQGDFSSRVVLESSDEIAYLGAAFNKMSEDLGSAVEAKIFKEKVSRELELAGEIQRELIPQTLPKVNGLELASVIIPAEEVGGDMYDFLKSGEDRLIFYLGDVTGHGVPAGIVSSIASSLFFAFSDEQDLKVLMNKVNQVLQVKTMSNMFMTLCLMSWCSEERKFSYVSAGHEQIVHYKAKDAKAGLLPAGGMALGMVLDISTLLKIEDVQVESGDVLVIYSDGVPESWKNEKEVYGMERLIAKVGELGGLGISAEEVKTLLLKDVQDFAAGYKQQDDITMVVVKIV